MFTLLSCFIPPSLVITRSDWNLKSLLSLQGAAKSRHHLPFWPYLLPHLFTVTRHPSLSFLSPVLQALSPTKHGLCTFHLLFKACFFLGSSCRWLLSTLQVSCHLSRKMVLMVPSVIFEEVLCQHPLCEACDLFKLWWVLLLSDQITQNMSLPLSDWNACVWSSVQSIVPYSAKDQRQTS